MSPNLLEGVGNEAAADLEESRMVSGGGARDEALDVAIDKAGKVLAYKCNHCERAFTSKGGLKTHITRTHSVKKPGNMSQFIPPQSSTQKMGGESDEETDGGLTDGGTTDGATTDGATTDGGDDV